YCVMPNQWHLVLWLYRNGDLSRFMSWLTLTRTLRRHAYRETLGTGSLSRPVHIVCRADRRSSIDGVSVCGAKRGTSGIGRTRRSLAME
ncbi:MAG: hypothetical protein KGO23_01875, partial [Nitrospirota bacterium]|nr:hypothetical protein [Nitrospirota bacterium]